MRRSEFIEPKFGSWLHVDGYVTAPPTTPTTTTLTVLGPDSTAWPQVKMKDFSFREIGVRRCIWLF